MNKLTVYNYVVVEYIHMIKVGKQYNENQRIVCFTSTQIPLTGYGGVSQLELEGMHKGQNGNFWTSMGHPIVGQNSIIKVNIKNSGDRAAYVKVLPFKG